MQSSSQKPMIIIHTMDRKTLVDIYLKRYLLRFQGRSQTCLDELEKKDISIGAGSSNKAGDTLICHCMNFFSTKILCLDIVSTSC